MLFLTNVDCIVEIALLYGTREWLLLLWLLLLLLFSCRRGAHITGLVS